jgi:hypothetical protein
MSGRHRLVEPAKAAVPSQGHHTSAAVRIHSHHIKAAPHEGRRAGGDGRRRDRALVYPFAAAGALGAAVLVVTALGLAASPVAGHPLAASSHPFEDSLTVAGRLRIWGAPGGDPAATASAQPAPPPGGPEQPAGREPAGQRPGTVALPRGGTATLVRREVGPDGTLPIAAGVREATWWGAGLDAPAGATVLAGHVNWHGAVGPFAELWQAQAGQLVSVVDAAGRPYRYRISQALTLNKDNLPARAAELFGQDGPHRLVLVTCGGEWVGGQLGYQDNRVVIATPMV